MTVDVSAQTKLLCALAADPEFLGQNAAKLRLSDFPSATVRLVFETLRAHWQRYGVLPSTKIFPDEVGNALRGIGPDGTESITTHVPESSVPAVAKCIGEVFHALAAPSSDQTGYWKDRLKEYLYTVRLAAMPGQDMSAGEQVAEAAKIKEEVESITGGSRRGQATTAKTRVIRKRTKIPRRYGTGVWPIDIRIGMGLELGEVGCILGGSGVGKTNVLINLAVNAAMKGQRALFLTLEVSKDRILSRLHAMAGNFPMSLLGTPEEEWPERELQRYDYMLDQVPVDYVTVNYEYVTKAPTCDDLDREIGNWREDMRKAGISDEDAPLVCVDYIRQIDPKGVASRDDNTNTKLGAIMQALKHIAMKHHCVLWTAQQITRAANRKEHIRKDDIADSIAIVNHCDVMLGFAEVGTTGNTAPTTQESEDDTVEQHSDKERLMNVDFVKLRNSGETGSFCTVFQGKSLRLWTSEQYARVVDNMAATAPFADFFTRLKPKER